MTGGDTRTDRRASGQGPETSRWGLSRRGGRSGTGGLGCRAFLWADILAPHSAQDHQTMNEALDPRSVAVLGAAERRRGRGRAQAHVGLDDQRAAPENQFHARMTKLSVA